MRVRKALALRTVQGIEDGVVGIKATPLPREELRPRVGAVRPIFPEAASYRVVLALVKDTELRQRLLRLIRGGNGKIRFILAYRLLLVVIDGVARDQPALSRRTLDRPAIAVKHQGAVCVPLQG